MRPVRNQAPGFVDVSGPAAVVGTKAHDWLAYLVRDNALTATEYVGCGHPNDVDNVLTAETAAALDDFLCTVWHYLRPEDELFVEATFGLPEVHEECAGTPDVIIRKPNGDVINIDYKSGTNPVPVVGNHQLILGGHAARAPSGRITGVIVQNAWNGGAIASAAEYTESEVQSVLFDATIAANGSADEAAHVPGKHCRYCWKASTCPAVAVIVDEVVTSPLPQGLTPAVAVIVDEVVTSPLPQGLTPATAPAALAKIGALEAYISAVNAEAFSLAIKGTPPTGYKLVHGRGSRDWASPDMAAKLEAATGVKLSAVQWLSVAQAEKALGKAAKQHMGEGVVVKTLGKPTLVTADHAGATYQPQQGGNFKPIDV